VGADKEVWEEGPDKGEKWDQRRGCGGEELDKGEEGPDKYLIRDPR
jgi:hypothetical protein